MLSGRILDYHHDVLTATFSLLKRQPLGFWVGTRRLSDPAGSPPLPIQQIERRDALRPLLLGRQMAKPGTRPTAKSRCGIEPVFWRFVPNVCPTRAYLRSLWSTSDDDERVRSICRSRDCAHFGDSMPRPENPRAHSSAFLITPAHCSVRR